MVPRKNNIGILVLNVPATVLEIRDEVLSLNNEKETEYCLGQSEIVYPDGGKESILTRFYKRSLDAHPDTFKVGGKIELEIQVEGEYAGRAVAKLGGSFADIERLLGKMQSKDLVIPESNLSQNLAEVEVVI